MPHSFRAYQNFHVANKGTWVMCSLATNWCEDAQYRSCGTRAHNMREDSRFSRLMMVAMMCIYMRK